MLKLGIDSGATYADVALLNDKKIIKTASVPSGEYSNTFLKKFVSENASMRENVCIACTGGKKLTACSAFKKLDEIKAIGDGARLLMEKTCKKFLVANAGTGTPFVFVDAQTAKHLGGTGVGGGALDGLAKLLLGRSACELDGLAKRGRPVLDLTVRDVCGGGVGVIPPEATAANFGKVTNPERAKKEDVALSLINMVAEIIAVNAAFAARSVNCNDVLFTGRVTAKNRLFRKRVESVAKIFEFKTHFPEHAEYATAIGAALNAA